MLDIKDLYWFAGLMEGEGCFGVTKHKPQQIRVEISSTDKDVIDRVTSLFKTFGARSQHALPSGKISYRWMASKQVEAAGLMMTLLPLMGRRRSEKIRECLAVWRGIRVHKRHHQYCHYGHPLYGDNLILYQEGKYLKRRCKECAKLRMRKHRAQRHVS